MKRAFPGVCGVVLFLAAANWCFAQTDNSPITYGVVRTIHSKVLGEDRTLLIRLPEDYEKSGKKYPVLYKLDGYPDVFLQAASTVRYLADMTDKAPEHIVVGIANTDRARDMDPERGAKVFVEFLRAEVVPFVEKNYRTSGFRILAGQSFSSLFALYSFVRQPDLFDAYILSSFGLHKDVLSGIFENELKSSRDLRSVGKKYIFVANARVDRYDPDGSNTRRAELFLKSLKEAVPTTVSFNSRIYEDEGHVPFPTLYDGLRWIYGQERTRANRAE